MRPLIAFLCGFLGACGGSNTVDGITPPDTFGKGSTPPHLSYDQFLPAAYGKDATTQWPMILSLHGAGGLIKEDNLIEVEAKKDPAFPFIVIAPRAANGWSNTALDLLIVETQARLRVDADRIYLTGLSMGAYGAWSMAIAYPHRYAAMATISGGGTAAEACTIKQLPVWAFANRTDPVVPATESESIVRALSACGGLARLTIYEQLAPDQWAHNAWQAAWTTPELYQWFLQLRRQP